MSLDSATAAIRAKAALAPKLGYRVTFDLGADGIIHWDGTAVPAVIGNDAGESDTTLTLSLDDLILTQFVAGAQSQTLPMLVYSSVRLGVDPQINVLATVIVALAASALVLSGWLTRRRA